MEEGARAVANLHEGEKEHGGDVPAPGGGAAGAEGGRLAREAASSEQEDVSGAGNAGGHGASGSESDDDDTEEALTEESEGVVAPAGNASHGDASGSAQDDDHEAPAPEENPATMAHFELRGFRPARRAIAHAMPPSSYRLPFRGRKRSNPSRLPIDDAGDAASGVGNARHDPATSEAATGPAASASPGSSLSATSRPVGAPAMASAGGHGGDSNEALGSTAARRSGKASDPERDVSPIHLTRTRPPEMDAAVGNSSAGAGAKHAVAAAAASCRLPSRSRKRRRPEHYPDTEEAVAAARARARRSDDALDRLLTSLVRASPSQPTPVWVTGAAASGGGPEEMNEENARVLAIAAILGAALALSVVSCVLFYIVGQQAASGPSDSRKEK